MNRLVSICLFFQWLSFVLCDHWAVLVAGSNGWYNYRHQADVCHAYQILHKNGIPDSNIIVMMFDDIANNKLNPTKGKIINVPNGENVYNSVPLDYVGKNVTPKNFLNVLLGNKEALKSIGSGKVLGSGPNDNVFIFFSDHGAPGLVAFPTGVLYATDLNKTITKMFEQKKYKKLVFYLEACESGSMFENILSKNENVYASTASNSKESSYACFYDEERGTYLGDLFSVNWMEDSETEQIEKETLSHQIAITRAQTNTSHVMEYGDLFLAKNETVGEFQGDSNFDFVRKIRKEKNLETKSKEKFDFVPSREVRLASIVRRLLIDGKNEELNKYLNERTAIFDRIEKIFLSAKSKMKNSEKNNFHREISLENFSCYRSVGERLNEKCFEIQNEFVLSKMKIFVNLCESKLDENEIFSSIDEICSERFDSI